MDTTQQTTDTGGDLLRAMGLVTKSQAAILLNCTSRTLDRMEGLRSGPPRVRIGNATYYRLSDIQAWIASQFEEKAKEREAVNSRRYRRAGRAA